MNLSLIIPILFLLFVIAMFLASRRWRSLARRETRVVLTGGGTGGHVNPALAIAEDIQKREPDAKFLYVGVRARRKV